MLDAPLRKKMKKESKRKKSLRRKEKSEGRKRKKKDRQYRKKEERKRKILQILTNIHFISARQSVEGQVIDQECIKEEGHS